jgi:signal transduction histidine kinase
MYDELLEYAFWCIPFLASLILFLALTYLFYKDRNKRKLMFAIGALLAAFGYYNIAANHVLGATYFESAHWLFVPITLAIPIAAFSGLFRLKNFETPFKIFLFGTVVYFLMSFTQFPLETLRIILMTSSMAISIPPLIYLFMKSRDSSDLIFLFATLCFSFGGIATDAGAVEEIPILLSFFGLIFAGLMFVVPTNRNGNSMSSFLVLEKQLDKANEDLRRAQEQLLKTERLAAIGDLAGMIGHDLRNPLQGIAGAAYYLKTRKNGLLEDKEREMLNTIEKCVAYSNKIVNDLVEYSKEINLDIVETNPQSLMEDTLRQVDVPVSVEIANQTQIQPTLVIDKDKIERVFKNLIKNAFDAMPDGGKLTIKSERAEDMVAFSFEDTGVGMSQETLSKIWTPLFTTKAKGMGFGLAICKRLIEAHEGKITVESTLGKGSLFTVMFPLKAKPTENGQNRYLSTADLAAKMDAMFAQARRNSKTANPAKNAPFKK